MQSAIFMNFTVSIVLLLLLLPSFEAKSQIVADAGGPYVVNTGATVLLNGSVLIPGENLKRIGLGLHNHHDVYNNFPPAIIRDSNGNPLLSWRVAILPYVDERALYDQFDLTKAWDDPANLHLLDQMPDVYRRLGSTGNDNYTDFAAPLGPNAAFTETGTLKFRDITDGTSNTLFVAETAQANIPWTAPVDVDLNTNPGIDDPNGFSSDLENVIMVSFVDASVLFLEKDAPQTLVDALLTRNGGEIIDYSSIVVDPGTIDTYEWDLDDDGIFETDGASPTFDASGLPEGSYPVHLLVTTSTGITALVSTLVEVECSRDDIISCGKNKILLCHVPKGNPANAQEICVSEKSARKHIEHHEHDYLGHCDCSTPNPTKSAKSDNVNTSVDIQNPIQIFPNPVSDVLQLRLWSEEIESIRWQIMDITGKLLSSKDQSTMQGENSFGLDLHHLEEGIYLLRLQSKTSDEVFKVVKTPR
jgi:hypothetical protein